MAHQSLCSVRGIPHSMQTRIRCFGGSLLPNSRFRNDTLCLPDGTIALIYVGRGNGVRGWRGSLEGGEGGRALTGAALYRRPAVAGPRRVKAALRYRGG